MTKRTVFSVFNVMCINVIIAAWLAPLSTTVIIVCGIGAFDFKHHRAKFTGRSKLIIRVCLI